MSSQFRIVFSGKILEGFEYPEVKRSAERKLQAGSEQVERLFSGKRATIKKGLAEAQANRYYAALRRIGMDVSVQPENLSASSNPALHSVIAPGDPRAETTERALPALETPSSERTEDGTSGFDSSKTLIVNGDILTELAPDHADWPSISLTDEPIPDFSAASAMPLELTELAEPAHKLDPLLDPTLNTDSLGEELATPDPQLLVSCPSCGSHVPATQIRATPPAVFAEDQLIAQRGERELPTPPSPLLAPPAPTTSQDRRGFYLVSGVVAVLLVLTLYAILS
jgi:hypothetical protein